MLHIPKGQVNNMLIFHLVMFNNQNMIIYFLKSNIPFISNAKQNDFTRPQSDLHVTKQDGKHVLLLPNLH